MSMKLYVGNLPYQFTQQELQDLCSPYGTVVSAVIITDKFSGRSKGFGFVELETKEAGEKAAAELNGKMIGGRPLRVNEARPLEERPPRREFRRNDRSEM